MSQNLSRYGRMMRLEAIGRSSQRSWPGLVQACSGAGGLRIDYQHRQVLVLIFVDPFEFLIWRSDQAPAQLIEVLWTPKFEWEWNAGHRRPIRNRLIWWDLPVMSVMNRFEIAFANCLSWEYTARCMWYTWHGYVQTSYFDYSAHPRVSKRKASAGRCIAKAVNVSTVTTRNSLALLDSHIYTVFWCTILVFSKECTSCTLLNAFAAPGQLQVAVQLCVISCDSQIVLYESCIASEFRCL